METQENQENQEKDILSLIESSIKKGNENIKSFNSKLLSNLKKIDKLQNIKNIVEKNLSEKNIYFIRHAESEHNVLEQKYSFFEFDKWNIYDPKLTEKGIEQTNSYTKEKTLEVVKKPEEPVSEETSSEEVKTKNPKTSDSIINYVLITILCITSLIIIKKAQ